ncbi:hypothetical protein KR009_005091, partial [Drosophila setifemur]
MQRLRRSTHSTDRSPPPPRRSHTHSESNDREYIRCSRDKGSRDWSRSPEYSSHRSRRKRSERSRSDVDEHKWPRTPPASIDSPTRPRSPDALDYDDDDSRSHYKVQSSHYRHSSESLNRRDRDRDDEERSCTPQEQFEPILSDDEIIGDDEEDDAEDAAAIAEYERELEAAARAAPPAIEAFEPWRNPLQFFDGDLAVHYTKELETLRLLFKKLAAQTRCENVSAFGEEHGVSVDEREQFVYLGEQLNNQLAYLTQNYKRRNFVLQQFFGNDEVHLRQAAHVLQIALSFQAACMQPQPAFKIRHIKLGARMVELLGSSENLFQHLLKEHQFDPFEAVFKLYHERYMALSIKLQLLKAIYALLDTRSGIKHFLNSKSNGYVVIMEALKKAKLTRTKYVLQAIIHKLHLWEALESVQAGCRQLLVDRNEEAGDVDFKAESAAICKKIEFSFKMLMDALNSAQLCYLQPRRFLPVSKKFEVVSDSSAQRSFANALQSYLGQHSLAESLLVMLGNCKILPATTYLCLLDTMHTLFRSHVGIDYFVDDAFPVTQAIVSILLGLDDMPRDADEMVFITENPAADTKPMEIAGDTAVGEPPSEISGQEDIKPVVVAPAPAPAPQMRPRPVPRSVLPRLAILGIEMSFKIQTRY